ncbi:hypothetical protein Taro_043364 [Colocasia esculenta]|uniref:APO domain-containing protein n=1 Tax=Colocasia esculenta TaxID=4460 RepID=A0A843X0J6_COLES|nr:hypothetical protein [Colocasia esculenta]
MIPVRRVRRLWPWPEQHLPRHAKTCFPSIRSAGIASSSTSPRGGGGVDDEEAAEQTPYADVPRRGRRWERKPYPTPVKELIRRAKEERWARLADPCRRLEHPPANGLLVPDLVPIALRVYSAWRFLLRGLARLLALPSFHAAVHRCRFCEELHVGRGGGHLVRSCEGPGSAARSGAHAWAWGGVRDVAHLPYCYHLHDRVGKPRVGHKERHLVPRLPAVVELCVQAGLDLEGYPARRRTKPVYSIDGRIVDFEPEESTSPALAAGSLPPIAPSEEEEEVGSGEEQLREVAGRTMEAWLEMRAGAERLMEKYAVQTCGYCPEVQVGAKGHKVRMCRAAGHQFRAGLHAWQEATVDDLLGTAYVWHVKGDPGGAPPANEVKRYYGKAPAVVELCVQAGAPPPRLYRSMMRLDVALPGLDERDLVA